MINIIFDIIDEMENEIKDEWNHELYKFKEGYSDKQSTECCMDILEGKAVILSQLKDRVYDMMNSDKCHIDLFEVE